MWAGTNSTTAVTVPASTSTKGNFGLAFAKGNGTGTDIYFASPDGSVLLVGSFPSLKRWDRLQMEEFKVVFAVNADGDEAGIKGTARKGQKATAFCFPQKLIIKLN